jgi:hypothetical protein
MAVYVNIKNPFIHDYKGEEFRDITYAELMDKAIKNGNDGVIFLNTKDPFSSTIYACFNEEQIKSSIGNKGEFSMNEKDIRKGMSGQSSGGNIAESKEPTKKTLMVEDLDKARTIDGYESPESGDIPEKEKSILAAAYSAARKKGYDKERSAKIAWGAVNNYRKGHKALRKAYTQIRIALIIPQIVKKGIQVDSDELYNGTMEELEHTDDWKMSMKIALDHLKENPEYYTKLKGAGL